MHHARIQLNAAEGIRRELFEGRMHTVVPAVIVVAGVLNEALVTAEELAKYPEGWNGRPIPIFHPTENGEPISANWPDVLERAAGKVFNVTFDKDRLRAEFWLDEQRMDSMGEAPLLASMSAGQTVEVSTGYFCDMLDQAGEFNGKPYKGQQINLRPDHVALLPGEIGACSIGDGCGAPRVNSEAAGVTKSNRAVELMKQLGAMLGLKTNCSCEGTIMTKAEILTQANALVANKTLEAKHLKALEGMDEEQVGMMSALLAAMTKPAAAAADPPVEDPLKDPAAAAAQPAANAGKPMTAAELKALISNGVAAAVAAELPKIQTNIERKAIVARIVANEGNAFAEADLQNMSVESLTKYEQTLRPVDYSGAAGGFAANAGGNEFASEFGSGFLLAPAAAKQ